MEKQDVEKQLQELDKLAEEHNQELDGMARRLNQDRDKVTDDKIKEVENLIREGKKRILARVKECRDAVGDGTELDSTYIEKKIKRCEDSIDEICEAYKEEAKFKIYIEFFSSRIKRFDKYSSRMRRIYIPLKKFKYFHKTTGINDEDDLFIGRDQQIEKLKMWLSDKDGNSAGSYLVTGFRGMGKSSLVGMTINKLIEEAGRSKKKLAIADWQIYY